MAQKWMSDQLSLLHESKHKINQKIKTELTDTVTQ